MTPTGNGEEVLVSSHASAANATQTIGQAHYSYSIVQRGWMLALEAAGYVPQPIDVPSSLFDPQWRAVFSPTRARPYHLMIRNFRSLRPLPWAYNIAVVAWEFDRITDADAGEPNPFRNQLGMLRGCDEVWVASNYAQTAIKRGGYPNVHVIPGVPTTERLDRAGQRARALSELFRAPSVSLSRGVGPSAKAEPIQPLGAVMRRRAGDRLFVSVLNPLDQRKDVGTLIEGFAEFSSRYPSAILLVKLALNPDRYDLSTFLTRTMPERVLKPFRPVSTPNVVLTNAVLSDEAMSAMYDQADAFVSPTRAEGQNLPLQEAMLRGVPVITPDHTAMADYIDDEAAWVVPSSRVPVDRSTFSPAYHLPDEMHWYDVASGDLRDTLSCFVEADAAAVERKVRCGRRTIMNRYGRDAVAGLISERLKRDGQST